MQFSIPDSGNHLFFSSSSPHSRYHATSRNLFSFLLSEFDKDRMGLETRPSFKLPTEIWRLLVTAKQFQPMSYGTLWCLWLCFSFATTITDLIYISNDSPTFNNRSALFVATLGHSVIVIVDMIYCYVGSDQITRIVHLRYDGWLYVFNVLYFYLYGW